MKRLAALALVLSGCGSDAAGRSAVELASLEPTTLTARGGTVVAKGRGFDEGVRVFVRDAEVPVRFVDGGQLLVDVPGLLAGPAPLRLERDDVVVESPEGLVIEPIPLEFVDAEPWRLPSLERVTSLATDGAGLVLGTSAGLARVSFDGSAFEVGLADVPEESSPVPVGRFAVSTDRARAIACSDDGTVLSAATRGTNSFTWPQPVAMPEGTRCGALAWWSDATGEALVTLLTDSSWRLSTAAFGPDGAVAGEVDAPALPGPPDALFVYDIDGDGRTDVLLGGPFGVRVLLGRGRSDGKPVFVDASPLPSRTARTFAFAALDADGDGFTDFFATGPGQDALFVDDGHGHFLNDAFRLLPFERSTGRALATGDLDLDGRTDVVIGSDDGPDRLYLSTGAGFVDRTPLLGLGDASRTRDAVLLDLDADGDLDLVSTDADGRLRVRFLVEPLEAP